MSLDALKWAWEQDCPNATSKLVLMALADHANSDGECWPSMKRVAELTGISSRQVSTHIVTLEGLGYVTRGKRRRYEGQLRGWEYRVNLRQNATSGSALPVASGSPAQVPAEAGFRSEPSENHQEEPIAAAPKKDELFESIATACGISLQGMTRTARGQLNKATKELREVGATPDQVAAKSKAYRQQYPNATLTPTALIKHWSSFAELEKKQQRKSVWETYERPEWY
ncbi:MAG TPA: helix-turn-helix domain-containing protein [Acidimicrobiia bacterium]